LFEGLNICSPLFNLFLAVLLLSVASTSGSRFNKSNVVYKCTALLDNSERVSFSFFGKFLLKVAGRMYFCNIERTAGAATPFPNFSFTGIL